MEDVTVNLVDDADVVAETKVVAAGASYSFTPADGTYKVVAQIPSGQGQEAAPPGGDVLGPFAIDASASGTATANFVITGVPGAPPPAPSGRGGVEGSTPGGGTSRVMLFRQGSAIPEQFCNCTGTYSFDFQQTTSKYWVQTSPASAKSPSDVLDSDLSSTDPPHTWDF